MSQLWEYIWQKCENWSALPFRGEDKLTSQQIQPACPRTSPFEKYQFRIFPISALPLLSPQARKSSWNHTSCLHIAKPKSPLLSSILASKDACAFPACVQRSQPTYVEPDYFFGIRRAPSVYPGNFKHPICLYGFTFNCGDSAIATLGKRFPVFLPREVHACWEYDSLTSYPFFYKREESDVYCSIICMFNESWTMLFISLSGQKAVSTTETRTIFHLINTVKVDSPRILDVVV